MSAGAWNLFLNEGSAVAAAKWCSSGVVASIGGAMSLEPLWQVSDELWARVEPLLPEQQRRFRFPGRKRVSDRLSFEGVVFVLRTGLPWQRVPRHDGRPSGTTCWRRFTEWTRAGVWPRLHAVLVEELDARGRLNLDRALVDSSQSLAKKGARSSAKARPTGVDPASSATS